MARLLCFAARSPDENPRADWLHEMLLSGGDVADVITYHLYAGYGLDPSLSKELVDPGAVFLLGELRACFQLVGCTPFGAGDPGYR